MILAMAGEALARYVGRGEIGRAGGLKEGRPGGGAAAANAGVGAGAGAGDDVSKADRMGSKF